MWLAHRSRARDLRSRTRALAGAFAMVLAVLLSSSEYLGAGEIEPEPAQPTPTATAPATQEHSSSGRHPARGEPERLVIPAIDVDTKVEPISMSAEHALAPPVDVTRAGWWSGSALPGSAQGTTLVVGHTVSVGGGVFDRLSELRPGDLVRVRTSAGWVDHRVTRVSDRTKDELEKEADALFSQDGAGRLALVTCSHYHRGSYEANTVVLAEPVG